MDAFQKEITVISINGSFYVTISKYNNLAIYITEKYEMQFQFQKNCEKYLTLLALIQKLIADLNHASSKIREHKDSQNILFTEQKLLQ